MKLFVFALGMLCSIQAHAIDEKVSRFKTLYGTVESITMDGPSAVGGTCLRAVHPATEEVADQLYTYFKNPADFGFVKNCIEKSFTPHSCDKPVVLYSIRNCIEP
jgi:hypothetical protein